MQFRISPIVLRRMVAAEGYMELGLPARAYEELCAIENSGPYAPIVAFMKGQSLKLQSRFEDAIEPLQEAAQSIPAPHNRDAWLLLGECFRHGGKPELADVVEMFADNPPVSMQDIEPILEISNSLKLAGVSPLQRDEIMLLMELELGFDEEMENLDMEDFDDPEFEDEEEYMGGSDFDDLNFE
jgi:tetratricopeptide (TPR) repeat protein